jgi:hypothetical protein
MIAFGWRQKHSDEPGLTRGPGVSRHKPDNLRISILDSKAYESPGGLPSATAEDTDLEKSAALAESKTP